jgi:DNA-binding NtrC family response regulator
MHGSHSSIMVVDDERDVLVIIESALQKYGFAIDKFSNPIEALAQFQKTPEAYSMLLVDIRMPAMAGPELAELAHRLNPRTRIVLMTAFGIDEILFKKFPSIKKEDVLVKPTVLGQICAEVKKRLA